MHVEDFLPANVFLVIILSLEQYLQFDKFCLLHVQMVNKIFSFRTKVIGNNAETSRINCNTF